MLVWLIITSCIFAIPQTDISIPLLFRTNPEHKPPQAKIQCEFPSCSTGSSACNLIFILNSYATSIITCNPNLSTSSISFSQVTSLSGKIVINHSLLKEINITITGNFHIQNLSIAHCKVFKINSFNSKIYFSGLTLKGIERIEIVPLSHSYLERCSASIAENKVEFKMNSSGNVKINIISDKLKFIVKTTGIIKIGVISLIGITGGIESHTSTINVKCFSLRTSIYSDSSVLSIENSSISIESFTFHAKSLINSYFSLQHHSNLTIQNLNLSLISQHNSPILFLTESSSVLLNSSTIKIHSTSTSPFLTSYSSTLIILNSMLQSTFLSPPFVLSSSNLYILSSAIYSCQSSNLVDSLTSNKIQLINAEIHQCRIQNISEINEIKVCHDKQCERSRVKEKCRDGYVFLDVCRPCNNGTYSMQVFNDFTCFECTENMTCIDQEIKPKKGVYRYTESKYLKVFRECPGINACGESIWDRELAMHVTQCQEGYCGTMCDSCSVGYTKTALHTCTECRDMAINIVTSILIIGFLVALSYILIKTSVTTGYHPKILYSVGLKIFINYIQVIFLCMQYRVSWPPAIYKVGGRTNEAVSDGGVINYFSIKCLVDKNLDDHELFYLRLAFMFGLPIIIAILSLLCLFLLRVFNSELRKYGFLVLFVPFFIIHPFVISYILAPLACESLIESRPDNFYESVKDSEYDSYLIENRSIWCDDTHFGKAFPFTLAGALGWGVLVPILAFISIFKRRRNFFKCSAKIHHGFLINGYKHQNYYWEFLLLFKKLALALLIVISQSDYNSSTQSVLIMTLLVFFFIIQLIVRPFNTNSLNDLELFASISAVITVFSAIVYSGSADSPPSLTKFLTFIMILTNSVFILLWLRFMLKDTIVYILDLIPMLKHRVNTSDGLNVELSKELRIIQHIYVKDFQRLYTQISDDDHEDENYIGYNKTYKLLLLDIIASSLHDYIENRAPIYKKIKKLKSFQAFPLIKT